MMQNIVSVASEVHEYIVERFLFGVDGHRLSHHDSLLEKGLLDSTGVLEVVMFIEQRYGITVDDHELIPDNLDSVDRIASFVERKRSR